jgi:hypothetical protein
MPSLTGEEIMKKLAKKCVLLFMVLTFTIIFTSFSHAVIKKDVAVGIWLLEEGKGNVVADTSGNGRDGKATGALKWGKGMFGGGIEFIGGDSVEVPNQDALNFGDKTSFSVVIWFNFGVAQDWNRIVRGRNAGAWGGGNTGWELQTQTAMVHWSLDDTAKNTIKNTFNNVSDGNWHHTAMIVDRSKKKLICYLDGENELSVDIANIVSITSGTPLVFGGGFKGSIDEVAIFNTAITQDDVKTIMTKGLAETLKGIIAVQPLSKLSVTWGDIKRGF